MGKKNANPIWRAVQYNGYAFTISPLGYVYPEYSLEEAEATAKAENARLEVELLAKEGKI